MSDTWNYSSTCSLHQGSQNLYPRPKVTSCFLHFLHAMKTSCSVSRQSFFDGREAAQRTGYRYTELNNQKHHARNTKGDLLFPTFSSCHENKLQHKPTVLLWWGAIQITKIFKGVKPFVLVVSLKCNCIWFHSSLNNTV